MPSAVRFFSASDAERRSGFSIWPTRLSKYLDSLFRNDVSNLSVSCFIILLYPNAAENTFKRPVNTTVWESQVACLIIGPDIRQDAFFLKGLDRKDVGGDGSLIEERCGAAVHLIYEENSCFLKGHRR